MLIATVLKMFFLIPGVKLKMGTQNVAVEKLIASLLLMAGPSKATVHATTMIMTIFGVTQKTVHGIIVVPNNGLMLTSCTFFILGNLVRENSTPPPCSASKLQCVEMRDC